jgi:membrane protease YdiL (CAAX protease family)
MTPAQMASVAVAWTVIALAVAFVLLGRPVLQLVLERMGLLHGGEPGPDMGLVMTRMQARYLVGVNDMLKVGPSLYKQARAMDAGSDLQRLSFVVVAGELEGPREALRLLDDLRVDEQDADVKRILQNLYGDYNADHLNGPSVNVRDRAELKQRLGWLGELALAPPGSGDAVRGPVLAPARRTATLMLVLFGLLLLAGVSGFGLLLLLVVLAFARKLKSHGERLGTSTGHIYAETFAVWMALFLGLGLIFSLLPLGRFGLLGSGAAALLSLAALAWPVIRGVPWGQVRREIGLTGGKRPALEPLFGPVCYLATLPLLVVGVLVMVFLAKVLGLGGMFGAGMAANDGQAPAHPLVGMMAEGGWVVWLQAVFVASVVAPIVEETMFRGVLYRHLREATGRWGMWVSVLCSALAVSFIFAVIHPQGFLAVPPLMALAIGFTLAREWRGSLVSCMIAHGLNNLMVTLLVIVMVT